jgi:hypothetical protein
MRRGLTLPDAVNASTWNARLSGQVPRSTMTVFARQHSRRNFATGARYARGMTTATRSVAVVATRLPDIDRRVLSQAWFSALHLAEPAAGSAAAAHPPTVASPGAGPMKRTRASADRPNNAAQIQMRSGSVRPASAQSLPEMERRTTGGELARRIEHAIVRHVARGPQRSAAIAIDAGDGRVHLLVRTDCATTRIVALCSPHLRDRVDRALAHARFALAAAGTRLEVAG